MAIISLYRDLADGAVSAPLLQYLSGLDETYGPEAFGPGGAAGALQRQGPALRRALGPAPSFGLEAYCAALLDAIAPLLPGALPDLYLATLLFCAPAATLSVGGKPALALGLERFRPAPPETGPKYWYHPREAEEMVPHEAAHAARMQVLRLAPTPRRLSLLEMVMLEGTALTFTDLLLGRETLATFMDPARLAWHRAHDQAVREAAAADFAITGMEIFRRYFSAGAPVSGYYAGYSLCREYLDRHGAGAISQLVAMPSAGILAALAQD